MSIRIGVVGHRNHHLPEYDRDAIAARLRDALEAIIRGAQTSDAVVITALAEGADRMGAHAALDLGLPIRCPLPFPRDEYENDFESEASRTEFRSLLDRAAVVDELPGKRGDGDAAYVEVGRRIVEESDVLVALWDGKPARGPGGTGDVVADALGSIPVVRVPVNPTEPPHLLVTRGSEEATDLPFSELSATIRRLGTGA